MQNVSVKQTLSDRLDTILGCFVGVSRSMDSFFLPHSEIFLILVLSGEDATSFVFQFPVSKKCSGCRALDGACVNGLIS